MTQEDKRIKGMSISSRNLGISENHAVQWSHSTGRIDAHTFGKLGILNSKGFIALLSLSFSATKAELSVGFDGL